MKKNIEIAIKTDVGKVRSKNEDNFVNLIDVFGNKDIAFIGAIDGVGGYAGGAEAASIAKEKLEKIVSESSEENNELLLRKAFVAANNEIFEQRFINPVHHKMSCVLTAAILDAQKEVLHFVHCGDTRAYILRNGELIKITKDHSLVGHLEDNNDILEEDAMRHPRRNEIFKLLGEKELLVDSDYFDIGSHSFNPGDLVFISSDGLTDLVNRASLIEILKTDISLEEKCQQLIDRANELGGKDNITVALGYFSNDGTELKSTTVENEQIALVDQQKGSKKNKKWMGNLFLLLAIVLLIIAILVLVISPKVILQYIIDNSSNNRLSTWATRLLDLLPK